jgi:hypothetical protein
VIERAQQVRQRRDPHAGERCAAAISKRSRLSPARLDLAQRLRVLRPATDASDSEPPQRANALL